MATILFVYKDRHIYCTAEEALMINDPDNPGTGEIFFISAFRIDQVPTKTLCQYIRGDEGAIVRFNTMNDALSAGLNAGMEYVDNE